MRILVDRQAQSLSATALRRVEAVASFHNVPAIITPTFPMRTQVDLLPAPLANVADEEIVRVAVEEEAEGGAQTIGPDLRARFTVPPERVVVRDRIIVPTRGV